MDHWSCMLMIGLCLRFVEGKVVHHHQPYHSKPLVHGNDIRLISLNDGEYQPAAGEILAKDSILYSQKPETRLLRRQLWPIMQETMDTLVDSVSVGANLFKNMLVTNSHPMATKIRNIKNAYISSSTVPHKKLTKFPAAKKVKKMKKLPESHRTRTVSEDYVHTYHDETYTVPTYVTKSSSKNPYLEMGLKDYKHFEETVLRELEEKEEKKVEATMGSLLHKKAKNMEEDLVQGVPADGWRPVIPKHDVHEQTNKPKEVGKLHTNFVSSGHDVIDGSMSQLHESVIEQPMTNGAGKLRRRKPNQNRSTTSTTTVSPPKPFTRRVPTQDAPNYPSHFLNKQRDVNKENQNSPDLSQELSYIKRMKFYREQMEGLTTSTTSRPPNAKDSLVIDASEEKFVFITPLPKLSTDRKVQRQKTKMYVPSVDGTNSGTKNRGSIKFSDSLSYE
ncbi:uncharacterized protein LOC119074018 isoform X2 [Bradysia coprophila]|uniref:uncharacterized protein LOC119074018 isoform X2 n=1 Tax=Bradysia coprophila TaxID=38358 RepID=UPI00187D87D1|nr:uncharacterized protein LOC119074018 isoform X2 [Bradysia coprophila]